MDLPMYQNMRELIKDPNTYYLDHLQALVNDRWENGTQTAFNVWQEEPFASDKWDEVQISIDTAIDIGTGFKKGDDFKVFSHKNISHQVPLGTMFKTDRDYWICINTNGFASPTNSCEVRRCNNIMKWIDPQTGYVNKQWCCIDYELSSPQPLKDRDIVVANGHVFITVQGNDRTRALKKNQRFIFNGQAYKLMGWQTLLDDEATQTHSNLLYIDMYLDMIKPTDDMVNMIANADDYKYSIDIQPDFDEQVQGFTGHISATVSLNGEVVDRELLWAGNDYVEVDTQGNYTLIGESGTVAKISVSIDGNPDLVATHEVTIVDTLEDNYEIVISPAFTEVRQKLPQSFSVYLYNNGVQQSNEVECDCSGANPSHYTLVQDGHDFILHVDKISTEPLVMTFISDEVTKTINVMLKPFF